MLPIGTGLFWFVYVPLSVAVMFFATRRFGGWGGFAECVLLYASTLVLHRI